MWPLTFLLAPSASCQVVSVTFSHSKGGDIVTETPHLLTLHLHLRRGWVSALSMGPPRAQTRGRPAGWGSQPESLPGKSDCLPVLSLLGQQGHCSDAHPGPSGGLQGVRELLSSSFHSTQPKLKGPMDNSFESTRKIRPSLGLIFFPFGKESR